MEFVRIAGNRDAAVSALLALWLTACGASSTSAPSVPSAPGSTGANPATVGAPTATGASASASSAVTDGELPAAYLAAVADAKNAGPDQLSDSLVALKTGAQDVVLNDDGTAAEMVTLTDWTGYAASVGQPMTLTREVWLTPVPQLQNTCRAYVANGGTDPSLRSLQYLGMPPKAKPVTVVTMMVPLSGMFRPTPDPQIDRTTAVFDDGTVQPADPVYPNHADWFRLQKALAYDPANPYPWTRMGYTYDWGDPADKIGASEFVVRQGTTVDIIADQTPAEYCAPSD